MSRLYAVKTWYDAREGILTLDDDVLGIVRQVRSLYGDRVAVNTDPDRGGYYFTEFTDDGTEKLIFWTEQLDARALERLQQADGQWRFHEDPYLQAERDQDKLQADIDRDAQERIRDVGEHLAHALKREGRADRLPLQVNVPKDVPHA
jgi:hypothetical protein